MKALLVGFALWCILIAIREHNTVVPPAAISTQVASETKPATAKSPFEFSGLTVARGIHSDYPVSPTPQESVWYEVIGRPLEDQNKLLVRDIALNRLVIVHDTNMKGSAQGPTDKFASNPGDLVSATYIEGSAFNPELNKTRVERRKGISYFYKHSEGFQSIVGDLQTGKLKLPTTTARFDPK